MWQSASQLTLRLIGLSCLGLGLLILLWSRTLKSDWLLLVSLWLVALFFVGGSIALSLGI